MGAAFLHPIKMALSSIIQEMYDILYIQFVILMSYIYIHQFIFVYINFGNANKIYI